MKVSAVTRCGAGKSVSDDRILVGGRILCGTDDAAGEFSGEVMLPCVLGVSDGVGGNAGGNIAAQYVCERIYGCSADMDDIAGVNAGLLELARNTPGKERMAATYSGLFISTERALTLLHIGNTRVYSVQGGYLKQLTSDMTTYNYYLSTGRVKEAENCRRSEITACFGGGTNSLFRPQFSEVTASGVLLMTSDGVHDYLTTDELEEILSVGSDISCCHEILDRALNAGSEDDMSIVIARL